MPKQVDDLLNEEGFEIPDDVLEIEALLEGEEADKATDLDKQQPGDEDKGKAADKGDEPGAKPEVKSGDELKAGDDKTVDKTVVDVVEDGPPKAVLRRERENRHKAETLLTEREQELEEARQRIADLEEATAKAGSSQDKLQAAADRLTGDPSIKLDALDKTKLEALRADLDDDVVDFLGKLVDRQNLLTEQLERVSRANQELVSQRDRTEAEQQQDDIDAVPLLSVVQATRTKEADALWDRAVAYEKALQSDPDWADKSRSELYTEVGRRLSAYLGDDAAKWLDETDDKAGKVDEKPDKSGLDKTKKGSNSGKTVEDKLAAARSRATPDSLSDLPTGLAAAQHEIERLEAMSVHDAEDLINKAIDKGNLDEVITRLSTLR